MNIYLKHMLVTGLTLTIALGITLYVFPDRSEASPLTLPAWRLTFAVDFNSATDLTGWSVDRGDGDYWVDAPDGYLHTESDWGMTYPFIWRNDLFDAINATHADYAVEVRARRPLLSAYGNAVGIGTAAAGRDRYAPGDMAPIQHYESVLMNEHHAPEGGANGHERVCLHQPGKSFASDGDWHTGRVEIANGQAAHYYDGTLIQTVACAPRAVSAYFGNAYTMTYVGMWSTMDVDYLRIYTKMETPQPSLFLPFIGR